MQFFKYCLTSIWFGVLSATPGNAACLICDELVELNAESATCFLDNYDQLSHHLDETGDERITVNFAACSGSNTSTDRGGLLTIPLLPKGGAGPRNIKMVYILDMRGISCLKDLLLEFDDTIDPSVSFDLFEECS